MINKIIGLVLIMPPLIFMLIFASGNIEHAKARKFFTAFADISAYLYLVELFCFGIYFLFK